MEEKSIFYVLFWFSMDRLNQVAYILEPYVILIISSVMIFHHKNKIIVVAFFGAVLGFIGRLSHFFFDEMRWVGSTYKDPLPEESKPLWFLYMYGPNIGNAIFLVAMLFLIIKQKGSLIKNGANKKNESRGR